MNKKIKNLLNKECEGVMAVESMILTPLIYITFLLLLYFFFMMVTYISYNNLANAIAQDLNMRQTGYLTAKATYPYMPLIKTNYINNGTQEGGFTYLSSSDVVVSRSGYGVLRNATYYALEKNEDRICIPYSEVKGIEVKTAKPIHPSDGSAMAGNVIKVTVKYQSFMRINFIGPGRDGGLFQNDLLMNAVGYNVIS
mgnify:CR=1 FL=1